MRNFICLLTFCSLSALAIATQAQQTGGAFTVTTTVIATGSNLSGGAYTADITFGEAIAGTSISGGQFGVQNGFWTPAAAANVTVSGKVRTSDGRGITNVMVFLTPVGGSPRIIISGRLGLYSFDNVGIGQDYIIQVAARRFTFPNNPRTITMIDSIAGLDFISIQ